MDHSSTSMMNHSMSMEHTMEPTMMTDHSMSSDHMGHDHGSDDAMGNTTTAGTGMGEPFCNGDGTVMLMGFQAASEASVNCVLFLFEGAGVTSETKYAFAVIGVFLMGFTNEMIRHGRDRMAKNSDNSFNSDFSRTVAFAVQMLLAYFLMLLVMLYEFVFLIAIILGLSAGHLLTLKLVADSRKRLLEAGGKAPSCGLASSGSPCCNTGTTA